MSIWTKRYKSLLLIFWGAFFGAFTVSLGFVEAYAYFELTWFDGTPIKSLAAVILIMLSIISGLSAVVGNVILHSERERAQNDKHTFDQSLVETLASAVNNKNYAEAIRIGIALNRPLFEAGNFVTRLKIGRIVEEAAALTGRKDIQIVTLIDSIGWSLVELGEYDEAQRVIAHGIEICQGVNNEFYEAKGYRHLGVIARRAEKFRDAEKYYKLSMEHAGKIVEQRDRDILVAGLNYAFAVLYFYEKDFDNASKYIDKSIASFAALKDEYRYNMSLVTKGDIEFHRGKADDAKDIYRSVMRKADRNTEKLQVVRSCLGLAEVYLADHQWEKAEESVRFVKTIDLKDFKAESVRLDRVCSKLPRDTANSKEAADN